MSSFSVNGDKHLRFHGFSEVFKGQYPEKKGKYYYMTINPLCVGGFLNYLLEGDIIDINGNFKNTVYRLDGIVAVEFGNTRFSPSMVLKLSKLTKKQIQEIKDCASEEGQIINHIGQTYLVRRYSDGGSEL